MTTAHRADIATNPYLREYEAMRAHQREHVDSEWPRLFHGQPDQFCYTCPRERPERIHEDTRVASRHDIKRRFSWAIPNDDALTAIAEHSPCGVVEIGAGGGYWAGVLRSRGVDVIAYDPDPEGGAWTDDSVRGWHDGTRWSDVLLGDHTAVQAHADRTLLLVWPSYDDPWTDMVLDLYGGDTVVYVGEGPGGCTGTDRMHRLLGEEGYCWHDDADPEDVCEHDKTEAKFEHVTAVDIPQWAGLHDRLYVYRRRG